MSAAGARNSHRAAGSYMEIQCLYTCRLLCVWCEVSPKRLAAAFGWNGGQSEVADSSYSVARQGVPAFLTQDWWTMAGLLQIHSWRSLQQNHLLQVSEQTMVLCSSALHWTKRLLISFCHKDLEGAIHDAGYRHFAKRREIGKCPLYKNIALLHCEKGESLPTIVKKISTEFPDLAPLVPEVYTKFWEELQEEFRNLTHETVNQALSWRKSCPCWADQSAMLSLEGLTGLMSVALVGIAPAIRFLGIFVDLHATGDRSWRSFSYDGVGDRNSGGQSASPSIGLGHVGGTFRRR